jgi:hypothetical protein
MKQPRAIIPADCGRPSIANDSAGAIPVYRLAAV